MVVERTSMGKAMKREHNPDWREGRKLKEIDNEQFEKLAQKQKNGIITVADCCRELGISRSTWYGRVRKVGVMYVLLLFLLFPFYVLAEILKHNK